jgi:hypothetical protein
MIDPLTLIILNQIESLGYSLKKQEEEYGDLVLTATHRTRGERHVGRIGADEPNAEYRCACLLAESVGIELEGG